MQIYDVGVVGHITKDVIEFQGKKYVKLGGVSYYFSIAAKAFGLNVVVLTKTSRDYKNNLKELEKYGIDILWKESKNTTLFRNIYGKSSDKRVQYVEKIADPFTLDEILEINAKIIHFGPLTNKDIDISVYEQVKKLKKCRISLDIQGHLREVKNNKVQLKKLENLDFLHYVDMLKCNEEEIQVLTGIKDMKKAIKTLSDYCNEIIVTLGSKGSIIYYEGNLYEIPVFKPRRFVDVTGCGDTYMATYLAMRYYGFGPKESGLFASMIAGLKIEKKGAWDIRINLLQELSQ